MWLDRPTLPVTARRPRAWRPEPGVEGADAGDAARCEAFLDRLEGMTRTEWLRTGRRALALPPGGAAAVALDDVVARRGLGVAAWVIRDTIETVAHVAACAHDDDGGRRHPAPPCTDGERTLLAAARRAAERAALAHLVRPWLACAHFVALVAPFVALAADQG